VGVGPSPGEGGPGRAEEGAAHRPPKRPKLTLIFTPWTPDPTTDPPRTQQEHCWTHETIRMLACTAAQHRDCWVRNVEGSAASTGFHELTPSPMDILYSVIPVCEQLTGLLMHLHEARAACRNKALRVVCVAELAALFHESIGHVPIWKAPKDWGTSKQDILKTTPHDQLRANLSSTVPGETRIFHKYEARETDGLPVLSTLSCRVAHVVYDETPHGLVQGNPRRASRSPEHRLRSTRQSPATSALTSGKRCPPR